MKLYALCTSGISGNMMVGALLDYGVPFAYFQKEIEKLHLAGFDYIYQPRSYEMHGCESMLQVVRLDDKTEEMADDNHIIHDEGPHARETVKQSDKVIVNHYRPMTGQRDVRIEGTFFDVTLHAITHQPVWKRTLRHWGRTVTKSIGVAPIVSHGVKRNYGDIVNIIRHSHVSDWVKEKSITAFTHLGEAEAAVHGVSIDKVHFHEVGAIDCIIDIVGTMIGMEYIGASELVISPLHVGTGQVYCDHGWMPVPTPATEQLLQGVPTFTTHVMGELVTPTGAALVKTLATHSVSSIEEMETCLTRCNAIGYGFGSLHLPIPNVLVIGSH